MITRKLCQVGEDGLIVYSYEFRAKIQEAQLRRGVIEITPLRTDHFPNGQAPSRSLPVSYHQYGVCSISSPNQIFGGPLTPAFAIAEFKFSDH
jgi:hypothetical protein